MVEPSDQGNSAACMRIIYRYISMQLLKTTLVVSSVLVLILVGGRFLRYLEHAAEGRLLGEVIFFIMAYRLPEFLQMILPLSLFVSILLCFGQLYVSSEMSVLSAAGLSRLQMIGLLLRPTLSLTVVVGLLSLYLGPLGIEKSSFIIHEQRNQSEFETLTPGRFHMNGRDNSVTYAQELSKQRDEMQTVFVAEFGHSVSNESQLSEAQEQERLVVVLAASGQRHLDPVTGQQYLELANGHRYEVAPGSGVVRVTEYERYKLRLAEQTLPTNIAGVTSIPTQQLWQSEDPASRAQLQWRISLPLLVPVVVLIAVPLSRVNPRQGRFLKIIPAIMLYLAYLGLLIDSKSRMEQGDLDPQLGIWWVHLLFMAIAWALNSYTRIIWRWRYWQEQKHFARTRPLALNPDRV